MQAIATESHSPSSERAETQDCCKVIKEVNAGIDRAEIRVSNSTCKIYEEATSYPVAYNDWCCLSSIQIVDHIRDCCGRGDFLGELLAGYSVEDIYNSGEHCYFLFCIALILDRISRDDTSAMQDIRTIIPFLRFSMRGRFYDPSREELPDKYLDMLRPSYQEVTGRDIKFSNGDAPTPAGFLHLCKCVSRNECCRSLFLLCPMSLEIRVADIKSSIGSGVSIPSSLVDICKAITYPGHEEHLLEIFRIDDEGEDGDEGKIERVELFIKIEFPNMGSVGDSDASGLYNILPSIRTYWRGEEFPNHWGHFDELDDFDGFREEGYDPPVENLGSTMNADEVCRLLDAIAAAEVPVVWNNCEITFREAGGYTST